jgi:hypothetical protein
MKRSEFFGLLELVAGDLADQFNKSGWNELSAQWHSVAAQHARARGLEIEDDVTSPIISAVVLLAKGGGEGDRVRLSFSMLIHLESAWEHYDEKVNLAGRHV